MAAGNKRTPAQGAPAIDYAAIHRYFDTLKQRWGLGDVNLYFSTEPQKEWLGYYEPKSKTVALSVPQLQASVRTLPIQDVQGAAMTFAAATLYHELAHGLQSQEMAGQQQRLALPFNRYTATPTPFQPQAAGFPHDVRHGQRTMTISNAELPALINMYRQRSLQEDDPLFKAAPELRPMFFGGGERPQFEDEPWSPVYGPIRSGGGFGVPVERTLGGRGGT